MLDSNKSTNEIVNFIVSDFEIFDVRHTALTSSPSNRVKR